MSKKRTKQYLMLLMVIGLVSIAAGGSGTFASFNAEVTNAGNTFATGSLFLHDTSGSTTCTSESNSTNVNPGTGVGGDKCSTLFPDIVFSDNTPQYADLTLKNAGSVDASDIKFALANACSEARAYENRGVTLSSGYTQGDATLAVSDLPVALYDGEHIELQSADKSTTDEVTVSGTAEPGDHSITISGSASNDYASGASVLFTADFGSANICSALKFVVDETTSSFSLASGATCAYPGSSAAGATGTGCDFTKPSVTTLDNVPVYTTVNPGDGLTALALANSGGTGNPGTDKLMAGGTRYFVIGVEPDTSAFDNAYQDRQASFDIVWHIDQ